MAQITVGRAMAFGFAKQNAVANTGTTVTAANIPTPTQTATGATTFGQNWIRWLQGSSHYPEGQFNHEWEGDGSRGESIAWKRFQNGKATHVCYPRPSDMAYLFQAFVGKNSNTVTGGSAPYTHLIYYPATDAGNEYYTITSFLRSSSYCLQSFDAMCYRITLSGGVGQPVKLQSEWVSGGNQFSTAPGAITLGTTVWNGASTTNVFTSSDGPYYYLASSIAAQLFSFSNLSTINAAIKDFTITFEAQLAPEDFASEYVFPLPLVMGNVTVTGELTMLWQDANAMALAYFGTTSPGTTSGTNSDILTTTAAQSAYGDILLSLNSSLIGGSSLSTYTTKIEIPNASYESVMFEPDLSGKPVEQKMTFHALKGGTYSTLTGAVSSSPFAVQVLNASPVSF